jgi:hypothetical protein
MDHVAGFSLYLICIELRAEWYMAEIPPDPHLALSKDELDTSIYGICSWDNADKLYTYIYNI